MQDDKPVPPGGTKVSDLERELDGALDGGAPPSAPADDDLERSLDAALGGSPEPPPPEATVPNEGAPVRSIVPESSVVEAYLVCIRGDMAGRTLPLNNAPWTIGRSHNAHVSLESKAVSSQHARIERTGEGFTLTDLGSTNGTQVNGRAVRRPVALHNGDTIEIANNALLFLTPDSDQANQTVSIERATNQLRLSAELPVAPGMGYPPGMMMPQPGTYPPAFYPVDGFGGEDPDKPLTLEDQIRRVIMALRVVARHWRKLLGFPALAGALAYATVFLRPPPAEAEGVLTVALPERDPLDQGEALNTEDRMRFFRQAERAFSERQLVVSTLEQLGETAPAGGRVLSVTSRLQIDPAAEGVFRVGFSDPDSAWAVRFLDFLLRNYMQTEIQKSLRVKQAGVEFLEARVAETGAQLAQTEAKRKQFMTELGANAPEYLLAKINTLPQLEADQTRLNGEIARLSAEVNASKRGVDDCGVQVSSLNLAPLEQSLRDERAKLTQAKQDGLGDEHYKVLAIKRTISDLERRIADAKKSTPTQGEIIANPTCASQMQRTREQQAALSGAQAQLGAISGQLREINEIIQKMPGVEAKYTLLSRGYEADKNTFNRLQEQLRQAESQLELERATAKARYEITIPAHSLGVPLRKAVITRTGIGIGFGLMLAVAIAAVVELRRLLKRMPTVFDDHEPGAVQIIGPNQSRPALGSRRS